MWVWCHTHQASHKYPQQELLSQMLALELWPEMHYGHWECTCVKDKVLTYTGGAIKGLYMVLEARAGMRSCI